MNSMGNLEKLGILVMVILVVVVGVVAITPQERVTAALGDEAAPETPPEALPTRKPAAPRAKWPDDEPTSRVPAGRATAPLESANPANAAHRTQPRIDTDVTPPARRPVTYTVRSGESLFAIAKSQLGDGARWHELVELNPALDPGDLREGDVLVLPRRDAQRSRPAVLPPPRRTHEVRSGETLSGIASKRLGSSTKWRQLLAANRDQLAQPEDLRAGMTLILPSVAEKAAAPRRTPKAVGRTYTVRNGDSLARIARRELAKESRWREIQRLNADVLGGGIELTPGMVLRLPE